MTESQTRPKPGPVPRYGPAARKAGKPDPEGYVEIAKNAVLDNYNSTRDETKAPELHPEDLFIVSYSRILQNWQCYITSPIARRLIWVVDFNNYRNEVYVSVYQKINSLKVPLGDKVPA